MLILGIETSCDETAATVVKDGTHILANVTATSAGLHEVTGGVIPEEAARKQLESILPVIDLALTDAGLAHTDIDQLAVTCGPGLIGSLLVGVETAKTLALAWAKPLVPVNHLVGHVYANWVEAKSTIAFPALVLVVSGGHTDLVLMRAHGKFAWLGGTRDDAAGEAFDKTARLLGLPYPGGPKLAQVADSYRKTHPDLTLFPRPMLTTPDYDWSFSGLKTAALNYVKDLYFTGRARHPLSLADYEQVAKDAKVKRAVPQLAAEIQEAICDVLVTKTLRAAAEYKPKSLLLSGGVAANARLKELFQAKLSAQRLPLAFQVPQPKYCTDNAAMIAAAAHFAGKPMPWEKIAADPSLTIADAAT